MHYFKNVYFYQWTSGWTRGIRQNAPKLVDQPEELVGTTSQNKCEASKLVYQPEKLVRMNAMLQNARSRRVDTENRTDGQVCQRNTKLNFCYVFAWNMFSIFIICFQCFCILNIFSIFMHFVDFLKRFSRCAA